MSDAELRRIRLEEWLERTRVTPESLADSELWVLYSLNSLIEEKLREHREINSEELRKRIPPDDAPQQHMDAFHDECQQHESEWNHRTVTLRAMLLYQAVGIAEQQLRSACERIERSTESKLRNMKGSPGVAKYIKYIRKNPPTQSGEFFDFIAFLENLNNLRNGIMHSGFIVPEAESGSKNQQLYRSAVDSFTGVSSNSITRELEISEEFAPWMLDQVRKLLIQLVGLKTS